VARFHWRRALWITTFGVKGMRERSAHRAAPTAIGLSSSSRRTIRRTCFGPIAISAQGKAVEVGFAYVTDPTNWPAFWPGYVRLAEGARWGAPGDTARLVTELLGRKRQLTMTVADFEPNRLVTYASRQPGLPDAFHERHLEPDGGGGGFVDRLVVEYEPRGGIAGLLDRLLLPRAVRHAFDRTFVALGEQLPPD
jgi:Polyketide cyclase / dehydrase and lipid transport